MTRRNCAGSVHDGWRFNNCSRAGSVERDGKWWCKQHDPDAVKARKDARHAKWQAHWDEMGLRRKQEEADRLILDLARKCYRQQATYDELMEAVAKREALGDTP